MSFCLSLDMRTDYLNDLIDIDDVIKSLRKLGIEQVKGNIFFPSNPDSLANILGHNSTERFAEGLADKLGIRIVEHKNRHTALNEGKGPVIYHVPGYLDDQYFLMCNSVNEFKDLVREFQNHGQTPPHFIIASGSGNNIEFRAKLAILDSKLYTAPRPIGYLYEKPPLLDKNIAEYQAEQG